MTTWVVEEPKWHWTIQQSLSHFQDQGILCDTSLACANGKTIKAHSCVLAAASNRIRTLLDGVQSNDYTLRMDSVTSTTWQYILRFIYDGRVALPLDQVERVKDAAVRFQIVPLINLLNTLERLKGQLGSTEESIDLRPSESCRDQGDVIVLDDDDDDGVVVESATDVTSCVMADDAVSVTGSVGDDVELVLSPSQRSCLPKSNNDCAMSTLVPLPETVSNLDDSCVDVTFENPRVRILETRESDVSGDNVSGISLQSTNVDSLQMLSESGSSSWASTVTQNSSLHTILRDARFSSKDAEVAFDVSEVVCMDSQTSNNAKAGVKAAEEGYDRSEGASEEGSLSILQNSFSSTAVPKSSSFPQPSLFAPSPVTDIFRQFTVSKPLRMILPKCGNTGTIKPALETVASDKNNVASKRGRKRQKPISPVETSETHTKPSDSATECESQRFNGLSEPGASEGQCGSGNVPEEGRPWEDLIENEAPLLCISNVVSLSGQVTDFSEPTSAFISTDSGYNRNPPLTAEDEFATYDDLQTRVSCVGDDSSVVTPFVSVSPSTVVKNKQVVNSSVSEATHTMQVSNCTEVIPRTEGPLLGPTLHINLPSSAVFSGAVPGSSDGSNSLQPSGESNLSSEPRALRFLVVRSAEVADVVSPFAPTQTSRSPEKVSLPNSTFPNIHLVSLPCASHNSTLPPSIVSSLSGGYGQFPVPSTVPIPGVPLRDLVEEFPVSSVPPTGHGKEFPFPSVPVSDPFPMVTLTDCVEEFPFPSVPLPVPSPVVPLSDCVEEFPVPFVPLPDVLLSGHLEPTPSKGCPRKNRYTFFAESTTRNRPQLFTKSVGPKRGLKRRKSSLEPAESPLIPSDSATVYSWPGESRRFDGCTKLTTDHDYQQKSLFGTSMSVAPKVKRLENAKKVLGPPSVVGPTRRNPDSQVTGGSFADDTSFVQPDSTVLETRPLPIGSDVYNFNESDSELNVFPGRPQPSITSSRPTGTFHKNGKEVKRRGRKPGQKFLKEPIQKLPKQPMQKLPKQPTQKFQKQPMQKFPKQPTQKKSAKQELLHEEDKPKKIRKMRKVLTVHESGDSGSTIDPPLDVKFVGREIRHEWVVETEPRSTQWYTGRVLSVVNGMDGEKMSQYEVKYEGEEMSYLVDHLLEDYLDGSLRFV